MNFNDINAINKQLQSMNMKPLSPATFQKMNAAERKEFVKSNLRITKQGGKNFRRNARTARRNAKPVISESLQRARMMHNTIRQGIASATGAISEFAAPAGGAKIIDAITQNTNGGVKTTTPGSSVVDTITDPLIRGKKYSKDGRDED